MQRFSGRTQGLIAVNLAAIIFGSSALYGKLDISPFWIVAARGGFAAITLFIFGFFRSQLEWPQKKQIRPIVISGAILALHWLAFFAAVQGGSIAIATLTFAAFPLFTILIHNIQARHWPKFSELIAGAVIILAVALLVGSPSIGADKAVGIAAGLISAVTFAWFGVASKNLAYEFSPLLISLYQNTIVAFVLLPFLFFIRPAPATLHDWLWLVLLGVITTACMHQLYFYALRRLSSTTCSGFVALEPVYAIIFAALLFSEPLTLQVGISGAMIIGASFTLLLHEKQVIV